MSPSNRKSSLNRETTSYIRNKNRKRSSLRTSENDNDVYYKRKKSIKHSQVDINNAVLTSPNGYMTRNKLNKHLTSNSELVETNVKEDKCSRINNISNKSETANKKTKSSNKIHKKMLELGFVFTDDILSQYPGKQVDTKYKKSIPSLFESDSDPEIDYFRIKDGVKNEVKELSTCTSYPDDICPAFDKNVEMRTYFNKKSHPINNKSNIKSLNIIEEINPEPTNSNNHVKTVNDSNLCKSISQNYSKIKKSLKVTAESASISQSKSVSFELCDQNYNNFNKNEISPTTSECIQTNTEDDDIIIVTESFIQQLKNEFEMIKTESQSIENRTQELFYDSNTIKSNNSDIEQLKDNKVVSKVLSSDFEVNQINVFSVDDICDVNTKSSICSNLSSKQDLGVIDESQKFISSPSPSKTTNHVENSLMSIFDEPKENILVESYANIKNNLIIELDSDSSTTISEEVIGLSSLQTFEFNNSNSNQSIENHLKSEKNIACQLSPDLIEPNQYFHSAIKDEINIKTVSFNNRGNSNCLIKTDNLSSTNNSNSKNYNKCYSKCYCKNFIGFNNNDNKIFTSKIKHFAFNDNANKVRQIKLHKKHLEANILNTLITKEHINIIQSRDHNIPIFNSILIGKKYEKCIDLKENDHIEPSILNMLKDVYVDVEYLTEYCDYNTSDHKLSEPQNNNKDKNVAILNNTSQNQSINLKACDGKYDDFNKKKTIDNLSISNTTTIEKPVNTKPCDGSYFNFDKNKTIDDFPSSNTTITEKPIDVKPCDGSYFNFDKNKTIDNLSISNTTTTNKAVNIKSCDGNYANFNKNKTIDNFPTSNTTITEKPVNTKPCDKSYFNFDKNKTIDNLSISNTTTIEKPVITKPCDGSYFNFNKNKTIDNLSISNTTTTNKAVNIKSYDGSYANFNKNKTIDNFPTSNTTITEKPVNTKPCDGSYFNFDKNKTIDNLSISNTTTIEKPVNNKPCDGSYFNFDKNKTIDDFPTSNTTITEKPVDVKPCDGSYFNFDKNKTIDNFPTSNTTITEKPVDVKPCDGSYFNIDKNKTIDNISISNTTITEKPVDVKPCDGSYFNFDKNKTIDNLSISNTTTIEKPVNNKPCGGSYFNFDKNKTIDDFPSSNTTITEKPVDVKPCDGSYFNFDKNKTIDNFSIFNSTTTEKPVNIKPSDGSYFNFDKNKTIGDVFISNTTIIEKPVNIKSCDESYVDHAYTLNNTMKNKPINIESLEENCVNFNKNIIFDNIPTSTSKLVNFEPCDHNYINCNKNEINSPRINFIKKDDFDCDSACNSHVINTEIDTKSKVKVEDDFNYDTTAMKYNFKSEKSPELDICHLSNSTMIINKNNDSKEELEILVKCNDIESENILSSVKINTDHGLTQTKISHSLKDKHIPVPAIIDNENETNISTYFEPPQFKNVFDTSDTISLKEYTFFPTLPHISENNAPVNKLFDLPADDIVFSLNNISSDDDDDDNERLLIEDVEPNIDGNINKNSTCILKSADSSKNERKINCLSSAASIKRFKFSEKKLISPKKQSSEINFIKNEEVSNPIFPKKKCVISNNNFEVTHLLEEEKKNYLDDCMSFEMCNELHKIKSSHKSIVNENESLPKYIQDILKEMYVDELFVSTCQHMLDLNDDDDQSKSDVFFQTNECRKIPYEKCVCDINTNVEEKIYSKYNRSVSTNVETLWKTEINYGTQENNKLSNLLTKENNSVSLLKPNDVKTKYPELRQSISTKEETILKSESIECKQQKNPINPTNTTQKSNSLQKPKNFKSNMKIRIHLREFILSNKPLDKILESKEFRNLRFFSEEEIASSIGVFIFEKTIETPIITGLSVYRVNYDQLNNEEKNKILTSTNLNITCPKILMLTSITLALVKMLRSDTLIEVILNYIRRNVLTKKINTDHTIDDQLIKQVVYFVDICVRLRRLKTLQIFIFDSMVFLPNKYCCIIFISLLLWKNCLPRSISTKEDPVIITVMSFLIAKKKLYSEQTVGCDIFQRELINLLSCHFNYTFSIDMPTNFIQHIHKPDFFVSVVMFLKCCDPKDLVEFMVDSLFPIIDNYLNTQQNEMHAIQTMESINMAIKPFKITCSTTVNTYLKKCKDPINGFKKNGKEHIYITAYNSYKVLQNKFIEYLNDNRPRSQFFEESLMTIILVLGSADYLTSCMSLIQWKPTFELSAILSKKIVIFKSIIGDNILWDKLCAIDDIDRLKCVVNSCLLNKDVYNTIIQLHNLR